MDSLGDYHKKSLIARPVRKWLNKEWMARGKGPLESALNRPNLFDVGSMPLFNPRVPTQENGCDCGVFMCRYAYSLYVTRHLPFTKNDIVDKCRSRITKNPAFHFGMKEIATLRENMTEIILKLSPIYLEALKRDKEQRRRNRRKLKEQQTRKRRKLNRGGDTDSGNDADDDDNSDGDQDDDDNRNRGGPKHKTDKLQEKDTSHQQSIQDQQDEPLLFHEDPQLMKDLGWDDSSRRSDVQSQNNSELDNKLEDSGKAIRNLRFSVQSESRTGDKERDFEIKRVSKFGKLPKCNLCGEDIERGRDIENPSWNIVTGGKHYCLLCLEHFSKPEKWKIFR